MPQQHEDSIIDSGLNQTMIETGRVINVNMRRWTADVRTTTSQSTFFDVQWGNAYLHFHSGEGIFVMPEVGAKCLITRPSDSPPCILCFVTTFERSEQQQQGGDEPQVEPDQSEDAQNPSINFSAGRPQLQQGDIMMRTRDGNEVYLRRGGVVEIGANKVARRYYIPLLNFIRDVCENYELFSPAGDMTWKVERDALTTARGGSGQSDRDVNVHFTITGRNYAQDAKATVAVRFGHVDSNNHFKMLIAPDAIDPRTLQVTGTAKFDLEIDNEGSIELTNDKDATVEIGQDLTANITNDANITIGGKVDQNVTGDHKTTVGGAHELRAASSRERISGAKVIESANIKLGGDGAIDGVALMNTYFAMWLMNHTHASSGARAEPQFMPNLAKANKVKGQ